jgi:Tol biopolymer transport system component
MAMAPDGSRVLYTILSGTERGNFRSQIFTVGTDGTGSSEILTDGKTLDITPTFSPGGDKILFSSNRGGWRMQIWSMSSRGEHGVARETSSQTNDLWPSLDSDPKPRLFYQAMVDTRGDARIYMTPLNTVRQTDLTVLGGTQPRIGPRNDVVLFCVTNEETGKRDIYRMSDTGANPQNLTNTPDTDECDPAWSRDGRRIAYASDRGLDRQGQRNYDIWVLDLARPEQPLQITVNGSVDDNPLFAPTDDAIYFRSNRGGEWGVWKIDLR